MMHRCTITLLEAHIKWIKEHKIMLSRLVQEAINKEIEKELMIKSLALQ